MIVTGDYLISKGFEKDADNFGWAKFCKGEFELVEIPLTNGKTVIGFEFKFKSQPKYKRPLTTEELDQLYKILIGKDL